MKPRKADGLKTTPHPTTGWSRKASRASRIGFVWSEYGIGRGWMFNGKMPTHMPREFGEALQTFWELMYFRSRWLSDYRRELSQLVDEERYADAFMLALQYDMQRQTVNEEEGVREEQEAHQRRRAVQREESERERAERERQEEAESLVRLQHLRDVMQQRRGDWREE